jgi:hypothetical protein
MYQKTTIKLLFCLPLTEGLEQAREVFKRRTHRHNHGLIGRKLVSMTPRHARRQHTVIVVKTGKSAERPCGCNDVQRPSRFLKDVFQYRSTFANEAACLGRHVRSVDRRCWVHGVFRSFTELSSTSTSPAASREIGRSPFILIG